jgi:glucosylceramidase
MRRIYRIAFVSAAVVLLSFMAGAQKKSGIKAWITDPAKQIYFKEEITEKFTGKLSDATVTIMIDDKTTYQSIDGFGFALTGGSAMNMMKMSAGARAGLLKELFGTDKDQIGTSYLRVSIGASDLDEKVFSYDDLPAGQTDTALLHFNLGYDKQYLLPVLKEILKINPAIKIMGSPWSPPVWMKDNHDTRGGSLLKEYYGVYARYLVKYILAMKKEGIRMDAVTVQNEPLHPGNNPSLLMLAPDQAEFVKNHLGPAFRKAKINTKIIIYDHNADKPDYPISILDDPKAKKYIDGSAFHMYAGKIDALSKVHDAHPDRNLYFTEQWIGAPGNFAGDIAWHIETLIIGATRNWAKTVLEWNLASDPEYKPYTDRGGCKTCLGAVTISGDQFTRNPAYYIIAHASKFVRPGSVRISSTPVDQLPNVAFKTPSGKMVLIVLNRSRVVKPIQIIYRKQTELMFLEAGAVATYVW